MKTIYLPFINILKYNLTNHPNYIQIITGPRQVGKTTTILYFLKKEYKKDKYLYVSADNNFNNNYNFILENWQKARRSKQLLIIDEIQKIDNWANVVKALWDEEKYKKDKINCILLGSSSLNIQKGISESLVGRYQLINVHHWSYANTTKLRKMNLNDYLKYGGYPGSYEFINNNETWINYIQKSIIEPVIEKDILLNHNIKSPSLFKQCFEILINYPACEISYTKLLGQLQDKGNTDLVKYYIDLFKGAFLIETIQKFSNKATIKKASSPKILPLAPSFYYVNIQDEYTNEQIGKVFELAVGLVLLKLSGKLYYWRERNFEVDYIFKKGNKLFAIEVKSNKVKKLSGLKKFINIYKDAKPVIISKDNYSDFEKDPLAFLLNS